MLSGKKVLLGITGSIAAYKAAELVRLFKKAGALVKVIQTRASIDFVTPLTLSTVSGNKVLIEMTEDGVWNNHVDLGLWADLFLIAPVTANSMSKMVKGEADNFLLTTYLSAKCPVFFAPAMDLDMYKHESTQNNISHLQDYGNILIPSGFGDLASGLVGEGRMAEPGEILESIVFYLSRDLPLSDKRVLITAGPTYEFLDPVRFIGNRSSGKMGVAIAMEAANNGAKVDLIIGPSNIKCVHTNIKIYNVTSAEEMFCKTDELFSSSDISIFSAAVADYTTFFEEKNKIKKKNDELLIRLKKTKDILSIMSKRKRKDQYVVGFALETENEIENAISKLEAKKLDMIIMNSLNNTGSGFEYNTNKITIIDKKKNINNFKLKDKKDVAKDIIKYIINQIL